MRELKELHIDDAIGKAALDYAVLFMKDTLTSMDDAADFKDRLAASQTILKPSVDMLAEETVLITILLT